LAAARWFLIFLPSSVGMIGFSHAAATDMPFAGMISVAMVCAAVVLGLDRGSGADVAEGTKDDAEMGATPGQAGAQHAVPLQDLDQRPNYKIVALGLFGFFLGLAVLAKGPAAIILCGGGVFFWAIFTGCWRDAFRLLHPAAIVAFCVTALPWYVICTRRNPDFFRIFIIEHNFKRYLTPEFQHVQPFWYYVPVLLVAFLPWIGLFLWSVIVGTKEIIRRGGASNATLFLICWAGFCVVFFSTSHSKLPGYVLPAFPAIGLLMARVSNKMGLGRRVSFGIAHFVAAAGFLALVAVLELLASSHGFGGAKFAADVAPLMLLFALANGITGMFAGWGRFRPGGIAAALAVVPVLASVLLANVLVAPFFRWDPSGRAISKEVERQRIPPGMLAVTNMKRGQQYSLSFYLHNEIRDWDPASKTGGYLLTGSKICEAVVGAGFYCEAQPFDLDGTGRFLYLVIPIAGGKSR
jgi:4-amino-4-deoxy-L-arabinose transferase-like glycosyltransferase